MSGPTSDYRRSLAERCISWCLHHWPYKKMLTSEPVSDRQLGGDYLTAVPLLDGEECVGRFAANRMQRRFRAVGGILFVTNLRLVFCPHVFDARFGGAVWACGLADIQILGREAHLAAKSDGAIRRRLLIGLKSGAVEKFVINHMATVTTAIQHAAGLGAATPA